MKRLKNILYLYKLDWRRLFSNPIAIFLVCALMFIPSLYAWFNIKALWDPYGNTSGIPIAVYSADEGGELRGKKIDIGEEVTKNLKENDQLGWTFVKSKDEVTKGVQSGKYYAGIYLPEDFTEDLLSFTTGKLEKPTIEYYFNEKINAIAPKITAKGASSLQEQITENFIKTASKTLLEVSNDIGYNLETNLASINKIKHLILTTDENLGKIDGYTKEVLEIQSRLPEVKEKIGQAHQLTNRFSDIDALGDRMIELDGKMPEIEKQAAIILTLQSKIPDIENAGRQLAMVDNDFKKIEQTMDDGIREAKQGLQIIGEVQAMLPDLRKLGHQASDFTKTTEEAALELQKAIPGINQSVKANLEMIGGMSASLNKWAHQLSELLENDELTDEQQEKIRQTLQEVSKALDSQQQLIDQMITWLTNLQDQVGGDFSGTINQLKELQGSLGTLQQSVDRLLQMPTLPKEELQNFVKQLETVSGNVAAITEKISVDDITRQVDDVLTNKLIPMLQNAEKLLGQAENIDFESLLSSTSQTVSSAIELLEKYQKELPAIGNQIHEANVMLNDHMDDIVKGINKGVDVYQNDLPVMKEKLHTASLFMQNDWPKLKQKTTSTLETVDEKMPKVEEAVNTAADLIQTNWPSVENGVKKAAEAIRKGEENVDLAEVIKMLKFDVEKESDFFTRPVNLKTNTFYPMENNGSASTPFYTALCLWVGALLLSSVATVDYHLSERDKKRFTKRETYVARMLTFLTFALGQALIVSLGNYFALGVDTRNPFFSILFAVLVGLTFMMIIYTFVGLFGNVGKGIGIIILVLSISGGGGNYPIQVSGKFFQAIHPFLPFTYAVNLLRESGGGIYWPNAWLNITVLVCLLFAFAAIGIFGYPHLSPRSKKVSEIAQKSHFFH